MRRRNAWVAALMLAAGGCDWYYNDVPSPDQLWYLVPWFDHMIAAKYVHPYQSAEVPRYTVEGTVPITGGEADWAAEWAAAKTTTADALRNPTVGGADSAARHGSEAARIPADLAARGDSLYRTFCATCHGETGKGEGLVGRRMGA
ncbi:MAG TPA: cytochrome c, partial [Gemmatimonadales bacterium]|nr:cytochrome c [Gemmatimonadales bacterium]